jgi:4-hydroxythreonine-4-phosphate dehydrogenase
MTSKPRLLLTMGDVAGIGPEIIASAWPQLADMCRPVVVGDPWWLRRALELVHARARVAIVNRPDEVAPDPTVVPCLPASNENLEDVPAGRMSAAAGRAAFAFLCRAIDLTVAGQADGIVTAPIHKEGLRAAGIQHPGHTEILAERTGVNDFGMVLYARSNDIPDGLAVVHVTLHMRLREVFNHLSTDAIYVKIRLLDDLLVDLHGRRPRLGIAALNPHAGDGGLFGDEEARIIQPAVSRARSDGIMATGPWPCDTLFVRARKSDFDGIVAMYHDQGHIALKLLSALRAVNITVGLPLVRTSVAHGTAYDIAGQGVADPGSLVEAVRVAARLVEQRAIRHATHLNRAI